MSLEKIILEWCTENKQLKRVVHTYLAHEKDGDSPPEYIKLSTMTLFLSKVLTTTNMLKRIQNTQEKYMVSREKQVLARLFERPAFWCFFAIKEVHGDDFLTIEDLLSGETHLLYSPILCSREKMPGIPINNLLSLMMDWGGYLSNIGLI
ncbi:MAG: hypothetical protein PF495_19765, partial [Spirochaetales bacterium]|nr:hypothetical protein [Spirochaetales bacterium]